MQPPKECEKHLVGNRGTRDSVKEAHWVVATILLIER